LNWETEARRYSRISTSSYIAKPRISNPKYFMLLLQAQKSSLIPQTFMSNYCVPSSVLGCEDTAVNKIDMIPSILIELPVHFLKHATGVKHSKSTH
jgi:hypothetical protein